MIASWSEDDLRYKIYHDSIGSNRVNWSIDLDELNDIENEFFQRKILSKKKARNISKIFSSKLSSNYWKGRPDILIEIVDKNKDELKKIIIGEVKHTNSENTVKNGLKELFDYIYLVRKAGKEEFIFDYENKENKLEIIGLLLFDQINIEDEQIIKGLKLKPHESTPLYIKNANLNLN